ncbi:MAG TPA: ester cyclase [Chloroflexia bacterium]|nr:ester cyclase [Chloroflexia bacterium]
MAEADNKAVARRFFEEVVSQRNLTILPEILADDLHEPIRRFLTTIFLPFPDWQVTIDDQIAAGDQVATLGTSRGTHEYAWPSPIGLIPPTGKPFTVTWTITVRVAGGQITQVVRASWDYVGMLQQLGVLGTRP